MAKTKNPKFFRKNKGGKTTRILKRGLTAKEKSEVKEIAKKTIVNVAEAKYMNTQRIIADRPAPSIAGADVRVSVLAYSTSLSSDGGGISLTYGKNDVGGDQPITELKMLRPFVGVTGNNQTDNYAVEGRECMPKSANVKWRMSRDIGGVLDYQSLPINNIPDLTTSLPIICRMIRVNPKQSQTNVLCNPKFDLFLDRFNNAVGLEIGSFEDTELLSYRLNRRRYNVVEDKFFRIQNGLTLTYQLDNNSASGNDFYMPQISNTNGNCEKIYSTNHQLTQKKGGSVFYDSPDANALEAPSSGHKREFILYHFCYAGAETYLSDSNTGPSYPSDLLLSATPTVKFTDI